MKPLKLVRLAVLGVALIALNSCSKETDEYPESNFAPDPSKSTASLSSVLAASKQMVGIVDISSQLLQEELTNDYSQYLEGNVNFDSEIQLLDYYSNIFVDEQAVYDKLSKLRSLYQSLFSDFPELQRMSNEELQHTLQEAYEECYTNDPPIAPCTDPDCAESVAIGAAFCLPSLAVAGWGYFVCAAGVAISAMHCCYG